MQITSYNEKSTSFLSHKAKATSDKENYTGTPTLSLADGTPISGGELFWGAIATGSSVVLVPYSSGEIGLVDSAGNYTAGPSGFATARFRGGCLTDNEKVVFAPLLNTAIGVYDLKTGTYKDGASVPNGTGSGPGFAGCCLLKDGTVLLAPRSRNTIGVYDPYTDEYREGPPHNQGNDAFSGCVSLPDGRALLIPYSADFFMVYDYRTGLLTETASSGGTAQYNGGVLTNDGDVVCSPYSKTSVGVYRTSTDQVFLKSDASLGASSKFSGCARSYDGRVIFAPHNAGNVCSYDPSTNVFSVGDSVSGATSYSGCAQLASGDMILAPYTKQNLGIATVSSGFASSEAIRSNLFFNSTF